MNVAVTTDTEIASNFDLGAGATVEPLNVVSACDGTVIRQTRNLDEHRRLPTHIE